jgi:hypothetical protein
MRSIVMLSSLLVLLTSLSAASGLESSAEGTNRSSIGREPVFNSEANLCQSAKGNGVGIPDSLLTASSSATWQWLFGPESCLDWCPEEGCKWYCPAAPCPPNPAGQPCSPLGAECYQKVGTAYFHYYRCWS